jgi:hypothetical protein
VRWAVAFALMLVGCRGDGRGSTPSEPSSPVAAEPAAAPVAPAGARTPGATETAVAPVPEPKPETEAPLEVEARESNPSSEKVTIKLTVWPVDANVFWGNKNLGVAGKQPLEIERPRGSGPVDLVARAPGYLPFHTRVFTDRDERLTVRLVRIEDAPQLLGYKRGAGGAPGTP